MGEEFREKFRRGLSDIDILENDFKKQKIFEKIFFDGPVSKYEISKLTNVPQATTWRLVKVLEKAGFVGLVEKKKKRKKKLYDITLRGFSNACEYIGLPPNPLYFFERAIAKEEDPEIKSWAEDIVTVAKLSKKFENAIFSYVIEYDKNIFAMGPFCEPIACFISLEKLKARDKELWKHACIALVKTGELKAHINSLKKMTGNLEVYLKEGMSTQIKKIRRAKPPGPQPHPSR